MTGGGDHIFARWSRRKQAVRDAEMAPPDEGEGASEAAAPQAGAEPGEPAEPAEPLPRLEDLTPESNLSAFLREGVPQALKSAAMRKMWSLDPAIRDYVGPSEYAWNFNEAGSMAGFGPLEDGGKAAAAFLSTMSERARSGMAKLAAAEIPEQQGAEPGEGASGSSREEPEAAPPREQSPEPPDALADPQPSQPGSVPVAGSGEAAPPAEPPRPTARQRHGRAMPR